MSTLRAPVGGFAPALDLRTFGEKKKDRTSAAAVNEEWPEITGGDIGASMKLKMERAKEPKIMSMKHVSTGDLKTLKKNDSFLYYSIPGVRRAEMTQKDIDMTTLASPPMSRSYMSCPSRLQTDKTKENLQLVTRKTRISFEVCPTLLEDDDIFTVAEDYDDLEDSDDLDDPLDAALERILASTSSEAVS